jgi:hypothetical protein
VVGVLAGAVRTTQLWTPDAEGTPHDGLIAGAELRLTEGPGDAHQGASISVRNRSVEAVLRVGVPLARLRGG